MLGLAALFLAATSAGASPSLVSTASWWEKVTYTISGDGRQSCIFESSLGAASAEACDDEESSEVRRAAGKSDGSYTKITIERRFSPGGQIEPFKLETGDTLLGGQVLALEIDKSGAVSSCETVATSKDLKPAYDCDAVRAERFEASAGRPNQHVRHGLMTILVYGHEEDLA